MNIIEIKNLNFSYGDKKILKDIDLKISEGKFTGILGPNGCGKSTLLKNILGYLNKDNGEIFLKGKKISAYSHKEKAELISYVPQKTHLIPDLTVKEFVIMGRLPYLKNSWNGYTKKDREIAEKYLYELELDNFCERKIFTLSGGEFQKVLLARALTQETEVILLDEPTSALDLNHALDLMKKIKNYTVKKNLTGIAVLHDLNLAGMFCDEIIMMKEGEIFYHGTPKEIFTPENMKKIYDLNCNIFYTEDGKPYVVPK